MGQNYDIGLSVLGIIAAFGFGLFMTLKPDIVWQIKHMFSVSGGEPTDFYLISTRIGGIVFMVCSAVCTVLLFFS